MTRKGGLEAAPFFLYLGIAKQHIFLVFTLLVSGNLFSQSDSLHSSVSTRRYFSYTYSNDLFDQTDRYFTQEIHPELVLPVFRKLPLMKILLQLKNSVVQYGLSGTQDCFTPASIQRDTILHGDRPFSGTIFMGHFKISNQQQKKQRLISEFDLGAIGPCAKCEEEQKGIHKMLNNLQPHGWQFQISNDLYLNYRVRYEKGFYAGTFMDLVALSEINTGTIYNNAALGGNLRVGKMQPWFENVRSRKLQLYGFVQGWVKAVAFNATMQGGFFSKSINTLAYSELEPVVLRGALGTTLSYKGISVEFCRIFITREIKTWWAHGWGYINISVYF